MRSFIEPAKYMCFTVIPSLLRELVPQRFIYLYMMAGV